MSAFNEFTQAEAGMFREFRLCATSRADVEE
jgi:hypothetical protein